MSDLRKATTTKADEPKQTTCCDRDQGKQGMHQSAFPIAPGKAEPIVRDAHKNADGVDGGCCGGGKAGK